MAKGKGCEAGATLDWDGVGDVVEAMREKGWERTVSSRKRLSRAALAQCDELEVG